MPDIQVHTASVALRVVPLTAKVLKQIPFASFAEMRAVLKDSPEAVVGWVDGTTIGKDGVFLLIKTAHDYALYHTNPDTAKKFQHLYVV